MASLGIADGDSPVRVVVTPSQSSYFAGEPFVVTVTFSNTRTPESLPASSPRTASHGHKRGAHSISSAPIARPPTSPGAFRTSTSIVPLRSSSLLVKKGLIGKDIADANDIPNLIEQRRKRMLAKSLSVSISRQELESTLADGRPPPSPLRQSYQESSQNSPISPANPSPLSRSPLLPLASNHPHARKNSAFDGQAQFHEVKSPLGTASSVNDSVPFTPSTSTFALALDPISEAITPPYPHTPTLSSPSIATPTTPTFPPTPNPMAGYPQTRHGRHNSQIGLGVPTNRSGTHLPRSALSSTFPQSNAELILYSYAQLVGKLTITPGQDISSNVEQAHTLTALRSSLLRRGAIGGGSMDITSSLASPPPSAKRHSRSASFSAGIMSLLSPTLASSSSALSPSASWNGRTRTVSGTGPLSPSPSWYTEAIDPDTPLPTFEVQPAMLAVDMSLPPGESRSYTYTVPLPDNLPPTFRGRVLKFSYELVIGTCRAGATPVGGPAGASASSNSISRVMKVPIRVYNHVEVGRTPSPYDLMWPLSKFSKIPSSEVNGRVVEETGRLRRAGDRLTPSVHQDGTVDDLQRYALGLLDSIAGVDGLRRRQADDVDMDISNWIAEGPRHDGGLTGCREAVEILTRTPKKASYDVNKDGVKVAVLTFTKSAYRLGETVLGVIELNERVNRSRVLQLSVMLETQEVFPSSIGNASNSRNLRRVHAEHHSIFSLSTLRTTFSLDIPSDASPAFQIKVGSDNIKSANSASTSSAGGLEWKVRLCLSVAVTSETSHAGREGVRFKSLVRDGPRGEWGSSWCAIPDVAPMENRWRSEQTLVAPVEIQSPTTRSWASALAASLLGSAENPFHDGDDEDEDSEDAGVYDGIKANPEGGVGVGVNFGGGQAGWSSLRTETVECEVPIKVWPGNTVFKAVDVVFDV